MTYRFEGHSMGDPERYREKEEVVKWREDDPIGIYNKYLVDEKIAKAADLDKIDAEAEAEMEAAVKFAEESPDPALETLFDHIYVEEN